MRTLEQQLRKARREERARGNWWGGLSLAWGGVATWLAWKSAGGNAALATGLGAAGLWAAPLLAMAGMRLPERQRRWARSGDGLEEWRAAGESMGIAVVRAQETRGLPAELAAELKTEAAALRKALKSGRRGDIEAVCVRVREGALTRHKEALWAASRAEVAEAEELLAAAAKEPSGAGDVVWDLSGGAAVAVIKRAMPGILEVDAWTGARDCMMHALQALATRGLKEERAAGVAAALAVEWQDTSLPLEVFPEAVERAMRRAGVEAGAGRERGGAAAEAGAAEAGPGAGAVAPEAAGEAEAGVEEHVRIVNGKRYRRVRVRQKSFRRRRHGGGAWAWALGPVAELGESFVRAVRMTWQRMRYGFRAWRMRQ